MYKFRKVQCPLCEHIFMWWEHGGDGFAYNRKNVNEKLRSTLCPKCDFSMVVLPNTLIGADPDDPMIEKIAAMWI